MSEEETKGQGNCEAVVEAEDTKVDCRSGTSQLPSMSEPSNSILVNVDLEPASGVPSNDGDKDLTADAASSPSKAVADAVAAMASYQNQTAQVRSSFVHISSINS